jgi:hypothetical protein
MSVPALFFLTNSFTTAASSGLFFAKGPGDVALAGHGGILVNRDVVKDLVPERGLVAVHHDQGDEAGIEHLEQVFIFQVLVCRHNLDRAFTFAFKAFVEFSKALVIAARFSDMDLFSGKVVEAGDFR